MGNVTAYDSIKDAFEGKDAVYNLVSPSPLKKPKGGREMYDKVHRGGTENVVRAAEKHDVGQYVHMSGVAADPDAETAYHRAKGQAEQIVTESVLDYTIFRPTVIFGDGDEFTSFTKMVAPPYVTPLPGGGNTEFQPIWVGDFTPMFADAIEDERHVGETYGIGGPDVLTLAEVARLIHESEGRSVNVVPIPMQVVRIGATVGGSTPGFPFGMDQYRSLSIDQTYDDDENDIDAFGVGRGELTTYRSYLEQRDA
jgi:NADH dehydrogenase